MTSLGEGITSQEVMSLDEEDDIAGMTSQRVMSRRCVEDDVTACNVAEKTYLGGGEGHGYGEIT